MRAHQIYRRYTVESKWSIDLNIVQSIMLSPARTLHTNFCHLNPLPSTVIINGEIPSKNDALRLCVDVFDPSRELMSLMVRYKTYPHSFVDSRKRSYALGHCNWNLNNNIEIH